MPTRSGSQRLETILKRGLVRMSWDRVNVYNLLERTRMVENQRTSTFKQTWIAKRETRGYHGEGISEDKFLRNHFNPLVKLPDMHSHPEAIKRLPPIAMLCFAELERRLDICVFRCHFAHSARAARGMVVHGHVTVNGKTVTRPSYVLQDGDIISVDPAVVVLLRAPEPEPEPASPASEGAAVANESGDAVSSVEAEGAPDGTRREPLSLSEPSEEAPSEVSTDEPPSPTIPTYKPYTAPNVSLSRQHLRSGQELDVNLPPYMSPFLFLPEYLEVDYLTMSCVFLRSPTLTPGKCELPTPWPAEHHALAYEWYSRRFNAMKPKRGTEGKVVVHGQEVRLKKKFANMWVREAEEKEREVEKRARDVEREVRDQATGRAGGKKVAVMESG